MLPDVVSIAQALIRCRSVTPADDGALDCVADLLTGAGFRVERPVFSEPGTPDIANLHARFGTDHGPCLAFAGHTDVVPSGDASLWRHDPFGGVIDDGVLYGRGAVDMKGGVAAFLHAALVFAANPNRPPGALAILLTGDEEGPAINGTAKLLEWLLERGQRFDACVLGEPTNPDRLGQTVKNGRRGSLTGRISVQGRQGHVAYPHLARNPVPTLARFVTALSRPPLDAGTASFDPSNLEWTTLDVANPAPNVIPAAARGQFNIRFNDRWTPGALEAEIRARLAAAAEPDERYELAFLPTNALSFVTEPGPFTALVQAAVQAETGEPAALSTSGGTSDARFITRHCPVVEFGLVGQTMHMSDECVPVADLEALARIYGRIVGAYLTANGSP